MRIEQTTPVLNVRDAAASSEFLQRHFGFRELMAAPGFASLRREAMSVVFMAVDSEVLPPGLRGQTAQGVVMAFTVPDVAAEEARLRAAGVTITLPLCEQPWGERLCMVSDPCGVVYELLQWTGEGAEGTSDAIQVRGARMNNLREVSLDLPKRRLTVFTGVSGSGKSSLVFATIAAESQRLLHETFPPFVQSFLPRYARPDVDALRNLSAATVVGQERLGGNARSTVGTATDAGALLRLLFARVGQPAVAGAYALSFNDPQGMCPDCQGLGKRSSVDVDRLLDRTKSLDEGAIVFPNFGVDSYFWTIFARSGFFDPQKKIADYTADELDRLLRSPECKVKNGTLRSTYEGLIPKLERLYLSKDLESLAPHLRAAVEQIVTFAPCPSCEGTRLSEAARACRIAGRNLADCAAMELDELASFVRAIEAPAVAPVVQSLGYLLDALLHVGLGYLSLARESTTLSGGESQRVKMVRHLGSSLTDMTYILDEPSIGLHPHDLQRITELLRRLCDKGNTVLVVEHKREVIAMADHLVDMGPGAGVDGGSVLYQGDLAGLLTSGTATGEHLTRPLSLKPTSRPARGHLAVQHARLHNLRDVSVQIPLGTLTAVTGVAGSGKSALIRGCLPAQHPSVVVVDQRVTRGSRRSSTATYSGVLDSIRKAFARANKVDAGLFSANSRGACPECKGLGVIYTDLAFLDGVSSPCETCEGRRFNAEVLTYTLRGKNIDEVLALSAREASAFFTEKDVRATMNALVDVGLGYLSLGQPVSTMSGGERQRLEVAIDLARAPSSSEVYVLDEPTTGLHMKDVEHLVGLLDRLVDSGRTVIVIEHNLDVIARADWVIDLGPGAGRHGGRVLFEGPPAQLASFDSATGRHLRAHGQARVPHPAPATALAG